MKLNIIDCMYQALKGQWPDACQHLADAFWLFGAVICKVNMINYFQDITSKKL